MSYKNDDILICIKKDHPFVRFTEGKEYKIKKEIKVVRTMYVISTDSVNERVVDEGYLDKFFSKRKK